MSVSDEGHRELRELLGSYALGHLPEDQVARVRAHLDGCRACRADLDDLLPVVRRLDAVDADAFGEVPAPPPGLGDDIWQAVSRERAERDAVREADEVVRLRPRTHPRPGRRRCRGGGARGGRRRRTGDRARARRGADGGDLDARGAG